MHSPAAFLPNIPVQASEDLAMALLVNRSWVSWNDMADLTPALQGGRDDSILSAKLFRIAPETSSF
jgi:hypothetical protein